MKPADRQRLFDLRKALLHLHKTLLDWERAAYVRVHGRASAGEWLKLIVEDPQFAWLRPISELIVRIDETMETEDADGASDSSMELEALIARARDVVAPATAHTPHAQRYLAALQEHPDAVLAHRAVTTILKSPSPSSS